MADIKMMTSAYANKMLKKLNEDKEFWCNKESDGFMYVAAVNEEPVVPDYDFEEVSGHIDEIDREIVALLNKRAGHSLVIRGLKPGAHLGLYDARREEEIFARVDSYNEGPLYNENLREIYATILKIMKETPSV